MEWYLSVLFFAISTTVTPGPNNIMLMSSGVNWGIKNSLPHLFGIAIGFPVMVAAVGLGFSSIFTLIPQLHFIIQCVGIVYLLYLSWLVAVSNNSSLNIATSATRISFKKAALFQWVNPKAWVMAMGAIATYTTSDSSFTFQVAYIVFIFFLIALPCLSLWLFFGYVLSKYLKNIHALKLFNCLMASLLVISLISSIQAVLSEIGRLNLL